MKPRKELKNDDSVDSDGMSSFDSKASRVNFWKDINIKQEDDEYTIVLNNKCNHKSPAGEQDDSHLPSPTASFQNGGKEHVNVKVSSVKAQLDLDKMENKMKRMKQEFQLTKKNMKKVCCDFAIDYFK